VTGRPGAGWPRLPRPWMIRWALLLLVLAGLEGAARAGGIDPLLMPPPSRMLIRLAEIVPTAEFGRDLARTAVTVAAAFALGTVAGLAIGILFWRVPLTGTALEPYLVSMYAMPSVVFYPVLLAFLGLGPAPIVAIASTMTVIPVALNTMVALREVRPTLLKLARSLNCTTAQAYRKVIAPAAVPLIVPGLVLGFIYAMIGTVAMEFILADRGLGHQIGYQYRSFAIEDMYAYILVVSIIAILVNLGLNQLERRIRRDME
jgi:NitT/TauT family transport system permease protein